MIKIVKGAEVDGPRGEAGGKRHGVFAYHADPELYPLVCGFSRQPLLDACRQLKSLYGVTGTPVGLFRRDGTPRISHARSKLARRPPSRSQTMVS